MLKIKVATISLAAVSISFLSAIAFDRHAFADMARGTSTSFQLVSGDVKVGNIVDFKNGEYALSAEPFDTEVFGVVVESSAISLTDPTLQNAKLIMHSGEAQVLVSATGGSIKKGDYITTSATPGIGQKADKTGFVVGVALEDLTTPNSGDTALVWAIIDPRTAYINNTVKMNLLQTLRTGAISPLLNPVESLRYILAALIVAATFIIGFSTFGKNSAHSIEALGRNPLAQGTIKAAMIFNVILSFGVMLVGLGLAYLILVL